MFSTCLIHSTRDRSPLLSRMFHSAHILLISRGPAPLSQLSLHSSLAPIGVRSLVGAKMKRVKAFALTLTFCAPTRDRTWDLLLKRELLYRLSYRRIGLFYSTYLLLNKVEQNSYCSSVTEVSQAHWFIL